MTPDKITIHCSDTDNGKTVPASEIRQWHLARGWKDIGYHMVILPSGEVQNGRPLNEEGAHVEGHNEGNIGICLNGRDHFTKAQFAALRYKIDSLLLTFDIKKNDIYCHYQFDSAIRQGKTCPNMEINRLLLWYAEKDERYIAPYLLPDNQVD